MPSPTSPLSSSTDQKLCSQVDQFRTDDRQIRAKIEPQLRPMLATGILKHKNLSSASSATLYHAMTAPLLA
jgi:hypothetical protein